MKKHVDFIMVMPVGPNCLTKHLADTITSVKYYSDCSFGIIIADDSQKDTGKELVETFPDAEVIKTTKNFGRHGGMYINLCSAYRFALENYDFKVLLKIDDDALVIGSNPQEEAIKYFENNPHVGLAGWHITGRHSSDCEGNMHDNSYPRNSLFAGAFTWKFIRRPVVNWALRQLLFKAFKNGYELGENIQGGAYYISRRCLQNLYDAGFLPLNRLKNSVLCEDHIFSLLTYATGMNIGDLSLNEDIFGISWKGLPAAPEKLYSNKKIIHSIRYWKEMGEAEIRAFFQDKRWSESFS
jgi:glycosyltransferase involved in cell wall biosynthesis